MTLRSLTLRIFLNCLLFAFLFPHSLLAAQMLSIKGDRVNLRSGPGINYRIKWEYGIGFPVKVLKKRADWYQVVDFEEEVGWIHKAHLSSTPFLIVKANKDSEKTVDIRSGPGDNTQIIGNAHYGVVFSLLERNNDWVKVGHESGMVGWVHSSVLWGI